MHPILDGNQYHLGIVFHLPSSLKLVHWLICGRLSCTRKSVGLENTLILRELSTQAWFAFPNVCNFRHIQKSLVGFGWKKM